MKIEFLREKNILNAFFIKQLKYYLRFLYVDTSANIEFEY